MGLTLKHFKAVIQFGFVLILFLLHGSEITAQAQQNTISGMVTDQSGLAIPSATVAFKDSQNGTLTDSNGEFTLTVEDAEQPVIYVQCMGFETAKVDLEESDINSGVIEVALKPSNFEINEVVVSGKSETFKIREKAYSVAALDIKKLQNSNFNVSNVLGRITGINIREQGGMGSDFEFSINGLSGKQVKFFIDGVPMENYGSSYSIKNIPVNLVERVAVYKGVVPVTLGSDALGGAVNIVTRDDINNYLDASYSVGSFNTHKAAINGKYTLNNTGLFIQAAAFFNYSDNDYEVDDIETHDELGNVTGTTSATRFHDEYKSAMIQTKLGLEDKSYADKLYFGLTVSGSRNNVQHGMSLERIFGQVHTRDELFMPTFEYLKKDLFAKGLSFRSYMSYIDGNYAVVDTSSREYNWDGSYVIRSNPNIGESDWQKSLFTFKDRTFLTVNNVTFESNTHELALNQTYTKFTREGDDPFDPDIVPFSDPNHLEKNVFGLSYTKTFLDKRLSATVFSKYFVFNGKTIEEDLYSEDPSSITHHSEFREPGYGAAVTFKFLNGLRLKTSYENAYRLPDGAEIFGNGLNVESNPLLQPEQSSNFNGGFLFHKMAGENSWSVQSNYFYRNAKNLIRQAATGAKSEYVNLAKANIQGIESEIKYRINRKFHITVNGTYQHLINKTQFDENGNKNHTYLDRLPNIPYFFGNIISGYQIHDLFGGDDKLELNWYSRYVHEYYLQWPGHGEDKPSIPTQFIHNLECDYSLKKGTYNVSLSVLNLLDSKAYDNYRIQKPGRAFSLKIRYFIK